MINIPVYMHYGCTEGDLFGIKVGLDSFSNELR